jgi:hypothetical protein
VIGFADAQGGVALEHGVRIRARASRDGVDDGSGGDEGEMKKGEQKKVTSVDRHTARYKRMEGIAERLGDRRGKQWAFYSHRAGWNSWHSGGG